MKISTPFLLQCLIHELLENNLLLVNNNTLDKVKKIIKQAEIESLSILFKEDYNFERIPDGYKLINTTLICYLSVLKETDDIELKSLVEWDKEYNNSIKCLEEWAAALLSRKDI